MLHCFADGGSFGLSLTFCLLYTNWVSSFFQPRFFWSQDDQQLECHKKENTLGMLLLLLQFSRSRLEDFSMLTNSQGNDLSFLQQFCPDKCSLSKVSWLRLRVNLCRLQDVANICNSFQGSDNTNGLLILVCQAREFMSQFPWLPEASSDTHLLFNRAWTFECQSQRPSWCNSAASCRWCTLAC